MGKPNIEVIVENQRATGNSPSFSLDSDQFSVQVVGATGSGSGEAVVEVRVTNVPDPQNDGDWVLAGEITLTLGTTRTTDALGVIVPYRRVRVTCTTLTGTGAYFSAYVCQG